MRYDHRLLPFGRGPLAQLFLRVGRRLGRGWGELFGKAGEHCGIDAIGFGELAGRLSEQAGTKRMMMATACLPPPDLGGQLDGIWRLPP